MIYSLNGILTYTDPNTAVVECAGVGYGCRVTYNTLRKLPETGNNVFLYTYMNVREDAVDLFGFVEKEELEMFKLLISVNGVGPKAAIAILSELSPNAVVVAISTGDAKTITRANGVGPKMAQRIVLELKDKVGASVSDDLDDAVSVVASTGDDKKEAISALVSLGYSSSEAQKAVAKCKDAVGVEQIIKEALKYLF